MIGTRAGKAGQSGLQGRQPTAAGSTWTWWGQYGHRSALTGMRHWSPLCGAGWKEGQERRKDGRGEWGNGCNELLTSIECGAAINCRRPQKAGVAQLASSP